MDLCIHDHPLARLRSHRHATLQGKHGPRAQAAAQEAAACRQDDHERLLMWFCGSRTRTAITRLRFMSRDCKNSRGFSAAPDHSIKQRRTGRPTWPRRNSRRSRIESATETIMRSTWIKAKRRPSNAARSRGPTARQTSQVRSTWSVYSWTSNPASRMSAQGWPATARSANSQRQADGRVGRPGSCPSWLPVLGQEPAFVLAPECRQARYASAPASSPSSAASLSVSSRCMFSRILSR